MVLGYTACRILVMEIWFFTTSYSYALKSFTWIIWVWISSSMKCMMWARKDLRSLSGQKVFTILSPFPHACWCTDRQTHSHSFFLSLPLFLSSYPSPRNSYLIWFKYMKTTIPNYSSIWKLPSLTFHITPSIKISRDNSDYLIPYRIHSHALLKVPVPIHTLWYLKIWDLSFSLLLSDLRSFHWPGK